MNQILHSQLSDYFKSVSDRLLPGVYLIHGHEMLVAQASKQLVTKLLDGEPADLCCEKMEGRIENLTDALERLNTYGMLAGPKIVIFEEAKLFEGRRNDQRLVEQIVESYGNDDIHQASTYLLKLCSIDAIELDRVLHGSYESKVINSVFGQIGSEGVGKLVAYSLSKGWTPLAAGDHVGVLQQAIEKGFPDRHYFIVTVNSKVPKNLKLYKFFRDRGVVIDCNVPMGERRADKAAQEVVLRRTLEGLLTKVQKRLSPGAFQSLCQLTGFDPRTFVQNVEKLIDYVGERPEILLEDIQVVLKRTKVDPVFELTNAVADRNLVQSLFYLGHLLEAKWHPLQVLSALANQMRKLLVAKSFVKSEYGNCWSRGMVYSDFQKSVMPVITEYDTQLREQTADWPEMLVVKAKKGRRRKEYALDVVLAANPKSPYPVYQTLLKSDKYTLIELIDAMANLNQADLRLKSIGQDAAMVLKNTLMEICMIKRG